VLWAVVAIPAFALSFWLLGVPPFWPQFSEDATQEGVLIYALFAACFYGAPLLLLAIRNLGREESQ
jgi:hypothetical protein